METLKLKDLDFEARCAVIAQVIHAANRQYAECIGGQIVKLPWEQIREEERQGLIKAVSSLIKEPKTPETSHEAWCEDRKAHGWTKDTVYSQHRKTHPNLVPYAELPFEEQFKDHLFMGIASIFVGGLEMFKMVEVIGEPVEVGIEDGVGSGEIDPEEGRDPAPPEPPTIDPSNLPDGLDENGQPLKEGNHEGSEDLTDTEKADTANNDTLEAKSADAAETAPAPPEDAKAESSTEAKAPAEDKGEKVENAKATKKKAKPKGSK